MFVSEVVAEKYASKEWPIDRIKSVHDRHLHMKGADEDRMYFECIGCPDCESCRCPIPLELHINETLI
jgi:hypothetical protein